MKSEQNLTAERPISLVYTCFKELLLHLTADNELKLDC